MAGAEAPAAPAPAVPEPSMGDDMGGDMGGESSNDKPFDDTPFDAGVEADEESDPKKFIEQLTGKLGQSLRSYTESQGGQPDFDLEKFAINSLLSATHTAEMTPEDQKDIINKVKKSGDGDGNAEPEADSDIPNDDLGGEPSMDEPTDDLGGESSMDEPADDLGEAVEDGGIISEFINTDKLKPLANKKMYSQAELDMILQMIYNSVDISGQYRLMDVITTLNLPSAENFLQEGKSLSGATAFPWRYESGENSSDGNGEMGNLFLNEVPKNNLFQPRTEITEGCWKGYRQVGLKEKDGKTVPNCVPIEESSLINYEKNSIFDKNYLRQKLTETFNQEDSMIEPEIAPTPEVKPSVAPSPITTPKRKNQPFLPMPEVQPDPKASNSNCDITEISPETFKSAINVSKDRGTDKRTHKLGQLYFNKFINQPLLGGVIKDIVVSNPQQSNYRQVTIQVEHNFGDAPVVRDSSKYSFIHYDIDRDFFDVGDKELDRKDAVILAKIAMLINPNSRYKETGKYFKIKGH